ncbi:RNA-binding protein Hfq [Peptococcaceae bacterium SCADC1_2_3]|jgi:host factor-I protein|nr:RNA-binding protein Hfq [Peptococcaceae bacterium SCADC1_2_3]KFI36720.1 RNA-binding protein Hfq [Peptococcaceae bacterium SCADC1_2_3]KFI38183.1 RNA-binding protein Hfq [Peptococcaceae bacterium SCADC1_2_3]HBQ29199.1 RNA chaperone Hfq [Desulfotomaculum sp.]HCJ78875.1 RNA chaperone Hfq [Desulfotomaculum sp.]
MTKTQLNLQDAFLNQIRKENILVTIFLVNGFQLKGMVKGFDNFTIILESEGKQMMVYKHAVSTISPGRRLNTSFSEPKTSPNVSPPEGGH